MDGTAKRKRDIAVQDFYFTIEQSPTSAQLLDALVGKKVLSKVTLRSKQTGTDKTFEIVFKAHLPAAADADVTGWSGCRQRIHVEHRDRGLRGVQRTLGVVGRPE